MQILRNGLGSAIVLALSLVSGSAFSQDEATTSATTETARVSNSQLFALQSQISALQHELQQLRGASEETSHATQALKGRQRDLYLDLDRRIRLLETNQQVTPSVTLPDASLKESSTTLFSDSSAQPTASDEQPGTESVEATISADPALVKETYQNALSLLKDKRYEKAMVGFRSFVQSYPTDDLADNAQYWLASTLYVIGEYDLALGEYQKLINNYAASNKYSEGLLKIAYIYQQQGKLSEAKGLLTQITTDYPDSTVGRLAERRLQKIANP